jgi:hypothetical protein
MHNEAFALAGVLLNPTTCRACSTKQDFYHGEHRENARRRSPPHGNHFLAGSYMNDRVLRLKTTTPCVKTTIHPRLSVLEMCRPLDQYY